VTKPLGYGTGSDIIPLLEDVLPSCGGLLVMLKAYLDLGAKQDSHDGVMCVASVIFKPTKYKQFLRPWNRMLKRWSATAFHATDFYPGAQEFKRNTPERNQWFKEDSESIPQLIGRAIESILLVSFRPTEFLREAPAKWKKQFGTSVHSHAVQLCLISNGWWRCDHYPNEKFAYFMESGDTDEGEVVKTVERMRHDTETGTGRVIGISSFSPVEKGTARGLEAADFAAWHWNKYYMDKLRLGEGANPRKDFAALLASTKKDRIKTIFATGANLKYFFSLVPPAALEGTNGKFKNL
jgi:hypothetical protein